jgi:V-type H+-transporting ATPase subunit E
MASRPLNDDEVLSEMNKMARFIAYLCQCNNIVVFGFFQVAFIKQEALEKAREIKVKADEEFTIDKVL